MADKKRFCIYCGNEDSETLTKGHVFPKIIGGRVHVTNCMYCNSTWGSQVEANIKKTPFFVLGISQLGIQSIDSAFKSISITDKDLGMKLQFKDGLLEAKSKVNKDGTIFGNRSFITDYFLGQTKKKLPNWMDQIKKQLEKKEDLLNIAGDKFHVKNLKGKRNILLEGLLFPYDLLAKITYDVMIGFGFPGFPALSNYYKETLSLNKRDGRTYKININKNFYHRIHSYHPHVLDGKVKIEKMQYSPFHRVDFRVASESNVAYVKLTFFEMVAFTVSVCKIDDSVRTDTFLNGKTFLFPIDRHSIIPEQLPARHSSIRKKEDEVATIRMQEYLNATKGYGNL